MLQIDQYFACCTVAVTTSFSSPGGRVFVLVSLQVFLQRSAVNLLGVVLDVPEFFWSAPDHLQVRPGLKEGRAVWDLVLYL